MELKIVALPITRIRLPNRIEGYGVVIDWVLLLFQIEIREIFALNPWLVQGKPKTSVGKRQSTPATVIIYFFQLLMCMLSHMLTIGLNVSCIYYDKLQG